MGNEIRVMVRSGQSVQYHASNGEVFEPISRIKRWRDSYAKDEEGD